MMRKADVSFEELYNCYKVRFERFAISYIQDRSVAEDIVTDSFVYWWEHRDRVGSKDENPAAYILATIRHKCLNHLRALQVRLRSHNEIRESQSRIVQENIRSLELCDPVHLFAGEVEALVRQSLEELPELTRYIFIDQRLKGKSYRDIAVEYAISERRVETELARALDKLRRRLKDYLPVILVSLVLSLAVHPFSSSTCRSGSTITTTRPLASLSYRLFNTKRRLRSLPVFTISS